MAAVLSSSGCLSAAMWLSQVVNPDGKPANIPNTNSATVSGLQPLSQDVINPTLIAVRRACQPAALSCLTHCYDMCKPLVIDSLFSVIDGFLSW